MPNYEYLPDPNVQAVCRKLQMRSEIGLAKYGCDTQRQDLSPADWLQHLQEELMDAAVYIEAVLKQPAPPLHQDEPHL